MTTTVDPGYCENNHCHCSAGFVQLTQKDEVTQVTRSVCVGTCPPGQARLSWTDACVEVGRLEHWNYSDGGAGGRPD